ncbi:alpha/beta-hydrolase [Peniophora sp. CONT]|nr:alpha/beta-hydrolase [Peniophora sp. CONT]
MPYVDLFSRDDFAQLYYHANTPTGSVSGFDPAKATLVLLHPFAFDLTWTASQMEDPRLGDRYNVIAFDSRFSGKSRTKLSGRLDYWVLAADLAYAIQTLRLAPAHVWAEGAESTNVAMRFAMLFPEMCLSLALVSVPPPTESRRFCISADDVLKMWGLAESLEDFEHANQELVEITVGNLTPPDELDRIVTFWQQTYPPTHRARFMGLMSLMLNRVPLTPSQLENIHQPVLLIHGEKNELHSVKHAERLQSRLSGAKGGARLAVIRGCDGFLSLQPSSSSIANQFYAKFLSSLPPARSDFITRPLSIPRRMAIALQDLADITHHPDVEDRDPLSCLSFSLVTPEVEKMQKDAFTRYHRGQRNAYSPLRPDGRPFREYSTRHNDHWFTSDGVDGLSHATGKAVAVQSVQEQRKGSLPSPQLPAMVEPSDSSSTSTSAPSTPTDYSLSLKLQRTASNTQAAIERLSNPRNTSSRGSLINGSPLTRYLSP